MTENSNQNVIQKAINSSNNFGQGRLFSTPTTKQEGKYNFVISEAQNTHIGDVYNYASSEKHPIPESVEKPDLEKFPYSEMYITKDPPENVAVLHIYENGDGKYSLLGGSHYHKLPATEPLQKPNITLRNLFQRDSTEVSKNIQDTQRNMKRFSKINLPLRKWLKSLRNTESDICLVIADFTDYEIPWEMFSLSLEGKSEDSYIGTSISIARWRYIIMEDDNLNLQFEKEICVGTTIAYQNNDLGESIWNGLRAILYKDVKQFQSHLIKKDIDCGLIYLTGIGVIRENEEEVIFGSELDDSQQITIRELEREQLQLIQNSKLLVFINASYSGVHFKDLDVSDSYTWGWVEFFLSRGAQGVIGSLGGVRNNYAFEFAHDFIHASQSSPHLSIAALIKNLRYQLVQESKNSSDAEEKQKSLEKLIHSFMYVYYGNPMMALRLTLEEGGIHG